MNIENVELHNIGALETISGQGNKSLVRIPAEVRNKLNERARFVGMDGYPHCAARILKADVQNIRTERSLSLRKRSCRLDR